MVRGHAKNTHIFTLYQLLKALLSFPVKYWLQVMMKIKINIFAVSYSRGVYIIYMLLKADSDKNTQQNFFFKVIDSN